MRDFKQRPRWSRHGTSVAAAAALGLVTAGVAWAAAGARDPAFGEDGVVTERSALVFVLEGRAVAIQRDGKIVVAGLVNFGTPDFAVWRYLPDGTRDDTFGSGGLAILILPDVEEARAVALQNDGKIVVAGVAGESSDRDFMLARFNVDGSLDTDFGNQGVVEVGFRLERPDEATAVAIQPDGKIVVGGMHSDIGTGFAVARLNRDGSPDQTFGARGWVVSGYAPSPLLSTVGGVALQQDGRIVIAGSTVRSGMPEDFGLARLKPDGTLDTSFDGDGRVITDFGPGNQDQAFGIAVQKDGKIIAAGGTESAAAGAHFALARYLKNGRLDPAFDQDGRVTTGPGAAGGARALAIQQDGKIVATGAATAEGSRVQGFALARYRRNGSLDPRFGAAGVALEEFGGPGGARSVALQRDGRIVAVGSFYLTGPAVVVARYLAR